MINKTCRNCKYWDEHKPPPFMSDHIMRRCSQTVVNAFPPFPDSIYQYDGSRGILTGPDFGCIHWEGRPVPDDTPDLTIQLMRGGKIRLVDAAGVLVAEHQLVSRD